jgi:PHD/YefM family antitoxin component YafN of YafNO toxin-antitoxin module
MATEIEPATPVQMRKSLEIVDELKRARIRFVPIPVLNESEYQTMMIFLQDKLTELENIANKESK